MSDRSELSKLSGPTRPSARGGAPSELVILLHGIGADGGDLIGLADEWARLLPGAAFIAPNGPERCDMAPMGYQWFSLISHSPDAMLAGARKAAPVINAFIDEELARHGLPDSRLALVGFSQGTIMSLFVALRRARPTACVVGFSGALIGAETLAEELSARPPILLVHGDADQIVPVAALQDAVGALGMLEVTCQWHISRGVGHGIDPEGLALGGAFLREHLG